MSGAANICVMQTEDLQSFVKDLVINRYEDRELNAQAAAQVLGISISTLNRWIDLNLVKSTNKIGGMRVERKFNLAYLLTLDLKQIKSDYRTLNK